MAREGRKYTIILTNYNDERFIKNALDSIFIQDYNNIQLIITDDFSEIFNKEEIAKYIKQHKKKNIKEVEFVENKKNIGTVRTLNKALKSAKGDYILFFASDDALANSSVVSNYVRAFETTDANIVTAQWKICDYSLNILGDFINSRKAKKLNKNIHKQYFKLCQSNIYGAGSTCYKKEIFEKYGLFDERYKYVEDWPFWLKMSKNSETIYFVNFDGLYHRSGGISTKIANVDKAKQFYKEILNTFVFYIIPYIDDFNDIEKIKILSSFYFQINYYRNYINVDEYETLLAKTTRKSKKLHILWLLELNLPHTIRKLSNTIKYNKITSVSTFISIMVDIILNNTLELSFPLLVYIIVYILIYTIVSMYYTLYKNRSRK